MTQYTLAPNPEMRKRHSALPPIMKYLFHQHFQEPQYRGTYYDDLLQSLEDGTKIVQMLVPKRFPTPVATYTALRENKSRWNNPNAMRMATEAIKVSEEIIFRACYLCEQRKIDMDTLSPWHPSLILGKERFTMWARAMDLDGLNHADCRAAYDRWVKRSPIGKAFEANRQRYDYALIGRRRDFGQTMETYRLTKKWLPPQALGKAENTR